MKKILFTVLLFPIFVMAKSSVVAPQDEYSYIVSSYQKKNWKNVIDHAKTTIKEFPEFPFLSDIYFYTGVAYFQNEDYDLANYYFSTFLKQYATPKYFEEAIVYKFHIAEKFEAGAKKHMMGWEKMPQWMPAYDDAMALYDEVITTLPKHEVAAQALFNKGSMLARTKKYKEAIEQFQTIIKRFPKNPLAPESYISIAGIYLEQCDAHYPDPDFLDLAKLNFRKFQHDFPNEARIQEVSAMLGQMQDYYAQDLWSSAAYYDKKKKKPAAIVYYQAIVQRYPESSYVEDAVKKLAALGVSSAQEDVAGVSDEQHLVISD